MLTRRQFVSAVAATAALGRSPGTAAARHNLIIRAPRDRPVENFWVYDWRRNSMTQVMVHSRQPD